MSEYYLSIQRIDGKPVKLRPGGHAERALIDAVVRSARDRGVGFFRSEASVVEAVRAALEEVIGAAKADVLPTP